MAEVSAKLSAPQDVKWKLATTTIAPPFKVPPAQSIAVLIAQGPECGTSDVSVSITAILCIFVFSFP